MIIALMPRFADPDRLADQRVVLEGEVEKEALPRLRDMALEGIGSVQGQIRFGRDDEKRVVMEGQAQASLSLSCQRCGAPFVQPVETAWRLVFARSQKDEHSLAEQGVDVWYHEGLVDVAMILEDEVMLALPMAPSHPFDCEPQQIQEAKPHPFAALAGLFEHGLHDK